MIELNEIAGKIQTALNTNQLGKSFRLFSNRGELVKRNGRSNEYRNGLVEFAPSTMFNISGLEFITTNVTLTLFANTEIRSKDKDGNSIEVLELYQILNDFITDHNWKTFAETYQEKTYSTTYVVGLPTNMPVTQLGYINDCLPIVVEIGLTYLENGVNSNQWKIYLDGYELGYTEAVISRIKTTEQVPSITDRSTKACIQANGFGLDLIIPQSTSAICNKLERELLRCDKDYAHMLYIKGNDTEVAHICVFGNTQGKLVPNLQVGMNVSLLEGVPELLDFEDNLWITKTVTVADLSHNTVTIENIDENELIIKYDDGTVVMSSAPEIYHTFATLGEHSIVLFNKEATTEDWGDIEIKPYIALDKMDYTVSDDKITITKVKAPATTYTMGGSFYVDGKILPVKVIGGGNSNIDIDAVNVTIIEPVEVIKQGAFQSTHLTNLTSLTTITLPSTLKEIQAFAFNQSGITNITLPNSIEIMNNNSIFSNCRNLVTINIPTGISFIPNFMLENCSSLKSITIPSNITRIAIASFRGCTGLTSITIPSGVLSIDNYAFKNCSSLTGITVEATTPPFIGTEVFYNTNNCPIYVPSASLSAYQSAWSAYANRLVGE